MIGRAYTSPPFLQAVASAFLLSPIAWSCQPSTPGDEDTMIMAGARIVDAANDPGYSHDKPPGVSEFDKEETVAKGQEGLVQTLGDTTNVQFSGSARFSFAVAEDEPEKNEDAYVLSLEGVEIDKMPSGHYEIYLNLPEDALPDFRSTYYVGNLTFFGLRPRGEMEEGEEGRSGEHMYAITRLVRDLKSTGEWTGKVRVTFRLAMPEPPADVVVEELESATIHIERIAVRRLPR